MMELGHHMKDLKSEFGVDFVLFDGEEYVFETNPIGGGDKYFFGSEHFADEYMKSKGKRKFRYEAGPAARSLASEGRAIESRAVLLRRGTEAVSSRCGAWRRTLGAKSFKYERGYEVQDDHLALNRAGIPTVDIIDFDYPHWHKLTDTSDKVSGDQMAEVSKVITTWVQKIK